MRPLTWWTERLLPRAVDLACGGAEAARWRTRVTAAASGVVLEVGFGSGLNLPHYPDAVAQVLAVEPADLAWERARERIARFGRPVERIGPDAARLPLPDAAVDAVVSTWTLCTIPDLKGALAEIARVLRPGGALHFVEHTVSSSPWIAAAQRGIQPVWGVWAGGCQLTRDIPGEVAAAGFALGPVERAGWFVSAASRPAR